MTYGELIDLYFSRSNALQWYWTVYVIVIGGLLAFSSLRQRPDLLTVVLVTVLYACFAYKNLGAIRDVTFERYAILELLKQPPQLQESGDVIQRVRSAILPTLNPPAYGGIGGVRNFHVMCDVLTIAALWAMELRRRRAWAERSRIGLPPDTV
ncbi:MAG TPA: hypothetical protein VGR35_03335 [Tepidisphaeraceae bacterium]|nr:hypothetical protein [Tepidisphaeraceae bacterium]